jgi:hypothetical protein
MFPRHFTALGAPCNTMRERTFDFAYVFAGNLTRTMPPWASTLPRALFPTYRLRPRRTSRTRCEIQRHPEIQSVSNPTHKKHHPHFIKPIKPRMVSPLSPVNKSKQKTKTKRRINLISPEPKHKPKQHPSPYSSPFKPLTTSSTCLANDEWSSPA